MAGKHLITKNVAFGRILDAVVRLNQIAIRAMRRKEIAVFRASAPSHPQSVNGMPTFLTHPYLPGSDYFSDFSRLPKTFPSMFYIVCVFNTKKKKNLVMINI